MRLDSSVLFLREGRRRIKVSFETTKRSIVYFNNLIKKISKFQSISFCEALSKTLNDNTFKIEFSTSEGWKNAENFLFEFKEIDDVRKYDNIRDYQSVILTIDLNRDFPIVEPLPNNELPALRIMITKKAWLFPYSWCSHIYLKKININVEVDGLKDIAIYNEIGKVDNNQAFSPFGINSDKGAWFAIGSFEMARKRIKEFDFYFQWRGLPQNRYGLAEYYANYKTKIDNNSFRIRKEYLQRGEWIEAQNDVLLF